MQRSETSATRFPVPVRFPDLTGKTSDPPFIPPYREGNLIHTGHLLSVSNHPQTSLRVPPCRAFCRQQKSVLILGTDP